MEQKTTELKTLTSVSQASDDDAAASSRCDHEASLDDRDDGETLGLRHHMSCKNTHSTCFPSFHLLLLHSRNLFLINLPFYLLFPQTFSVNVSFLTRDEFVWSISVGNFCEFSQDLCGFLCLRFQIGRDGVTHCKHTHFMVY